MKQTNKTLQNWESLELGTFVDLSDEKYVPNTAENIPCIELECIEQETGLLFKTISSKDLNSTKNKFYKNNVLFGKLRPYLKKYYLATFDGVCSSEIWVLIANNKVCLNKYLFYLVQTQRFLYYTNKSSGSKMPRADWNVVSQSTFLLPPIKEQEKIVDILELWDKAIETTKKLIEQKKLQKKYLMQKLLTGKIRLKGFKDRWKKYKLGDVCDFISGFSFSSNDFCDRGILLIKISNISNGKIVLSDEDVYLPIDYVYKYKQFVIKQNDLLIAMSGATTGKLAINTSNKQLLLNQRVGIIRTLKFNQNFINQYLFAFKNKFLKMSYGGAQPNISSEDIKKIIIYIPQNLTEQKAIADILSTADKQIDLLKQKLSKLELQKKGLMQKLLT